MCPKLKYKTAYIRKERMCQGPIRALNGIILHLLFVVHRRQEFIKSLADKDLGGEHREEHPHCLLEERIGLCPEVPMGALVKLRWDIKVQHTPCAREDYRNTAPDYIQGSSDIGYLDKMRTRTRKSAIRLEFLHLRNVRSIEGTASVVEVEYEIVDRHEASFEWMVSCGHGKRTDLALLIVEVIDGRRRKVEICSWYTSKPHSLPTQLHQ